MNVAWNFKNLILFCKSLDYDLLAAFPPLIYLVAALLLFYVYLSGEIFVWQAVGFVGFYLFFVGIVFWTDLGLSRNEKRSEMEMSEDCEIGRVKGLEQLEKIDAFGFAQVYGKVSNCMKKLCFFY
ncbi:cation/calcium exchanger 5-like isoform X2 [Citrus sinensis]|uniref:cation/calcium exchanger 5-like isoform X2 n=1 Tax=Citrus sinensis TaxID=2711 RepID=UPI0022783901|nr:cation/calcium exchanger 5-like isoform X2 [Citrus sinensis]